MWKEMSMGICGSRLSTCSARPRFKAIFKQRFGRTFSFAMEEDWKCKSKGIMSFKTPTMRHGTLRSEGVLCEGYRSKMLLYTLDELFYINDQVKCHRGTDEKLVVAYEILGLTMLHCMEH